MRIGCRFSLYNTCRFWITIAFTLIVQVCVAQTTLPDFDRAHREALEGNPPGVVFTLATANGKSEFHSSERIDVTEKFTSSKPGKYSVELEYNNAPGSNDIFVFKRRDGSAIQFSHYDIICCYSRRRYLRNSQLKTGSSVNMSYFQHYGSVAGPLPLMPPGDYDLYVQTRRVTRGWPDREHRYLKLGDLIVTSENVVHITILPDEAEQR